ncbi:hypothetical protein [Idiomarina aquatica]|uniref:Pilin accessory protein (PilO) n=1 Tax=Idiomarina aquatica TaxID=1327752 RepID=A0AA94JDQ4_9GAMM|nr:hypothetical protein [Idiomarina aquatica]RUO44883.1 hypothetical protein CWE23_02310 [Idiomarina aquatica]
MHLAIGLFRECWGIRQPPLKAVRQRAEQLGYHYARLYFVGGNWWLSLATSECCDLVMSVSAELDQHSDCWILVKHGQGPLLIHWHQGQLVRVCQQPLAACVEEFQQQCRDRAAAQCLQHGWNEELPAPWTDAGQVPVKFRHQRLLALEQLHYLPNYRRRRRLRLTAALLLAVGGAAVGLWYGWPTKPAMDHDADATAVAVLSWLPAGQVMTALLPVAASRWQGPWELTGITLSGASLSFEYRGHAPLALHSLQRTDAVGWQTASQRMPLTRRQQLSLTLQRRTQAEAPTVSELHGEALLLLAEQRPGLSLSQQGQQLILRWQNWSLAQLNELIQRLLPLALHSDSASLQAVGKGWNGEWVLTTTGKVVQ